jgi:nucleoside triphosphate pyrophosphatase
LTSAPASSNYARMPRLVLGSASPRRAALLRELGVDFDVLASDVPEVAVDGEAADAFARRVARDKGAAVARQRAGAWVLSADTIVVVDGTVLGKPVDAADARRMLACLAGRIHAVVTAVALTAPGGELADELLVRSGVEFRALTAAEIDAYVATGEPFDKAGAYAIQGGAASFVCRVSGSYTNVVGLPLDEVADLLARHEFLPSRTGPHALQPR